MFGFVANPLPALTRPSHHAQRIRLQAASQIDEIIKQPRLKGFQCRLLVAEKLRLGLAHLAAFLRVAVESVVGDFLTARLFQIAASLSALRPAHWS